jgi:cysteine synthase A
MGPFDFPTSTDDRAVRARAVALLKNKGIRLPTFTELADAAAAPQGVRAQLASIGPDDPHPLNLYRVNWFNDLKRTGQVTCPRASSCCSARCSR